MSRMETNRSNLGRRAQDAIARSSLSRVPDEVLTRLVVGARMRDLPAGTDVHRPGDPPFFDLVARGLIRAYVSAPNGRTMTIRYCRPGALMGTGTLFNDTSPQAKGSLTALVDSELVAFDPRTVRAVAERDLRLTRALLRETSARVADYINELQASSLATLRQRLARHLLDLAAEQQVGPRLVARASQEQLAAAIGSVREIVVRILREMRAEEIVRTGRAEVELLDPTRLEAETYASTRTSVL